MAARMKRGSRASLWGRGSLNTIQYLEDQAARAERLAKRITDTLTIEKLLTFADERRREIDLIAARYRRTQSA
ncbi:hypothetical protein KXV85_001466 [Aspergillus fumigatus]|nr:hypothetical protein KXV85_001466 [Aspergillus fumigatus]